MASMRSAVGFANDHMRMKSRLAFAGHNVAGKREHLDLLPDGDFFVGLLPAIKKSERDLAESADRG